MLLHEQMGVERGGIGVAPLAAEIAVGRLKPEIAVEPAGARSARLRSARSIANLQAA
jgi:hypothetical protein